MTPATLHTKPAISVVITCYNDGLYIDEAVASVKNSTFKNYELCIIDDCSTDTFTISRLDALENEGVVIYRKPANKGVGNSRNTGIKNAKSKYILPLDADDRIHPEYLAKAVKNLDEGYSVIYCSVKNFGEINSVRTAPDFSFSLLLSGNYIASCSAFTKNIWEQTGGYDESMSCYEDWEFFINAASKGARFLNIKEVLFEYRRKKSSLNSRSEDPAVRHEIVQYVCHKHASSYQSHAVEIFPNLHRVIASLEKNIKNIDAINESGSVAELINKLTDSENLLKHRTAYYENSIFWKLKKLIDRILGRK